MKAFTLAAVCLVGAASARADLRSDIDMMNKKVHAAMMKRDITAFVKVVKPRVTSDFKHIENGQTMSFDQMVETMKMSFQSMSKITKSTSKVLTLKVKGNVGTTTETHSMTGVMKGEDNKTHTMTFSGTTTNTYRKEGGVWKMSVMKWTSQKMAMDGKPMGAPGGQSK